MFESLKQHKFIFVIGPQLSRTTITAKMIAYDTGYQYVDENRMNYNLGAAYQLVDAETPFVLQCPSFTLYAPQIAKISGAFLVFLRRNREEILDSQERIDWQEKFQKTELYFYGRESGCISDIKKQAWEVHKTRFQNWMEVDASEATTELKYHPLWESDRSHFKPKQTNESS